MVNEHSSFKLVKLITLFGCRNFGVLNHYEICFIVIFVFPLLSFTYIVRKFMLWTFWRRRFCHLIIINEKVPLALFLAFFSSPSLPISFALSLHRSLFLCRQTYSEGRTCDLDDVFRISRFQGTRHS